jgi:DNA-directed RNA polymerase subunit K/omega
MEIFTPTDAARHAGTKYRSILVAAKFARYLNDFPKDRQIQWAETERTQKLTTLAMRKLVHGDLNFRELRRRRSEV